MTARTRKSFNDEKRTMIQNLHITVCSFRGGLNSNSTFSRLLSYVSYNALVFSLSIFQFKFCHSPNPINTLFASIILLKKMICWLYLCMHTKYSCTCTHTHTLISQTHLYLIFIHTWNAAKRSKYISHESSANIHVHTLSGRFSMASFCHRRRHLVVVVVVIIAVIVVVAIAAARFKYFFIHLIYPFRVSPFRILWKPLLSAIWMQCTAVGSGCHYSNVITEGTRSRECTPKW